MKYGLIAFLFALVLVAAGGAAASVHVPGDGGARMPDSPLPREKVMP
jgi:hypothetical protein